MQTCKQWQYQRLTLDLDMEYLPSHVKCSDGSLEVKRISRCSKSENEYSHHDVPHMPQLCNVSGKGLEVELRPAKLSRLEPIPCYFCRRLNKNINYTPSISLIISKHALSVSGPYHTPHYAFYKYCSTSRSKVWFCVLLRTTIQFTYSKPEMGIK